MGGNQRNLGDEEWLMVYALFFSTAVITIAQHTAIFPLSGAPAVRIALDDVRVDPMAATEGRVPVNARSPGNQAAVTPAQRGTADAQDMQAGPGVPGTGNDFRSGAGYYLADAEAAQAPAAGPAIQTAAAAAAPVRIAKDVYVQGERAGKLDIIVAQDGALLVDGRALKLLLARAAPQSAGGVAAGLGDGPISLQALRAVGIDLRYSRSDDAFRLAG